MIPQLVAQARAAAQLVLLLDYDGTLVPFARSPELARPDAEALALLRGLAARAGHRGARGQRPLARHPGALAGRAAHLPARRARAVVAGARASRARRVELPPLTWREPVLAILRDYAERTPGSLVEEKPVGLAWHYRAADPEYGAVQANELRLHLTEMLSNTPVEILPGEKVIEVRAHGVNKGRIVPAIVDPPCPARCSWPSATTAPTRICSPPCPPRPSPSTSAPLTAAPACA